MPAITVIIPTFNAPPDRLGRAAASALACAGVDRVVIVDDGSSEPVSLDEKLTGEHGAKIQLVRQGNAGPSSARNRGMALASTEFVLFLDDDDELIPGGVARLVSLADRLNSAGGVAARYEVKPGGRSELKPVPPEWGDRVLPDPGDVFRPIALFGASGALVHRRVPEAGVRFDESLRIGEDRDFWRRAAAIGRLAVSSDPALRVMLHGSGANLTSREHMARRIRDHLVLVDRYPDTRSQLHLRAATAWLVNAASKARVDHESWRALMGVCRARGWAVALKPRVRRLLAR